MKQIIWMGRSRHDLKEFPDGVRRAVGHALHGVQTGIAPSHAKVLSGLGNAKIWEIRENDRSGTYRAVYTVEFQNYVVVLHVFQKKSKTGIATPKEEIELIKQRLKDARERFS
jgi:phage-related protein